MSDLLTGVAERSELDSLFRDLTDESKLQFELEPDDLDALMDAWAASNPDLINEFVNEIRAEREMDDLYARALLNIPFDSLEMTEPNLTVELPDWLHEGDTLAFDIDR